MGEEKAFQNNRISDFQELVTLSLDRVILHTIMHHSSTSAYIPNFIEIKETFCVLLLFCLLFLCIIRSTPPSRPNKKEEEG